jgi:hypothetical protein
MGVSWRRFYAIRAIRAPSARRLRRLWQLVCAGLDRLGVGAGLLRNDQRQTPGSVLGLRTGTSARPDTHNRAPRP